MSAGLGASVGSARPASTGLLIVDDLHTYYGEAHILQGISLTIGEGEVVTLIGRNGAGKTTTLRSIMGIARPSRGRIRFGNQDVTGLSPHEIARRGIAWVPEERRVLPNLSVYDNLRLAMLGAGVRDDDGALLAEVFEFFPRLKERIEYRGRFLSGGEQQMLAIARGLVARPKLMLVDEPTEGLAPILVRTLTTILGEISRRGSTIMLVEQNLDVALTLSNRLYVIDQGRIQFSGTPDELRREPAIQQRFLGV
jgi:branched-chain amino acid transport system ATP-binding protein